LNSNSDRWRRYRVSAFRLRGAEGAWEVRAAAKPSKIRTRTLQSAGLGGTGVGNGKESHWFPQATGPGGGR
jgi:hypothetical protein